MDKTKLEECLPELREALLIIQEYGDIHFMLIEYLKRVDGTEGTRRWLYDLMDRRRAIEPKLKGVLNEPDSQDAECRDGEGAS